MRDSVTGLAQRSRSLVRDIASHVLCMSHVLASSCVGEINGTRNFCARRMHVDMNVGQNAYSPLYPPSCEDPLQGRQSARRLVAY